ncbi:MAG: chromosome segregation protein [Actinomycetota bacterium]|jgi:chromosome segregation protein|nr:chromosome segregation protein [Actinomycetota bacterium]
MFVKTLRLAGFKSFADPTVLEFQPGVNVIVGPNGSGKSNISDALSWVLGSQAPSSLRGASMEDVIFAGSSGRPRLGMAEVELTLDNTSRILPLDLAEVTISRSTDRAGSTEYRINGAACRLLDIQELLSDTGIGRSIHTIVGQGQLAAILDARPEDRRSFIEEAAQIGKFRRRKDRALRKIERVEENMVRLNDVLSELRRAIRPLKRQASAAAMYSELVGRHRDLKQRLAATELHRLSDVNAVFDPDVEGHRMELLQDELSHTRARLEDAGGERDRLTEAANHAQEMSYRIARASDRLSNLGRLAEERAETIAARLAAETEEGYRERIRLLENEKKRWRVSASELRTAADQSRAQSDEIRGRADAKRSAVEETERSLSNARGEETLAAQALVRAEGSEAAGRATIGSIEARVAAVQERRAVMNKDIAHDQQTVQEAERDVRNLEAELDNATEAAAASEARLEEARERAEMLKDRLSATHSDRAAASARLTALEEVVGLLHDHPQATERIEPLIVDARQRAELASTGDQQAAEIFEAAETVIEQRWTEVARQDEELRRLDALMSGAAERLAGAKRRHEVREIELAALDEELSRTRDALASAERDATEERATLPARKAAVDEARAAREQAESVLRRAREELAAASAEVSVAELEARTTDERALAAQLRLEEAESGIADAQAALSGLEDLRAQLARRRQRAEQIARAAVFAAERAGVWAREAEQRAARTREEAQESDQRLTAMRARERELTQSLEEVTRKQNEAAVRRAETRARTEAIAERAMEEWAMSVDELTQLERFTQEQEAESRTEVEKLDREMKRLGAVNPHAAEEFRELSEREEFLVTQIDDLQSGKRDLMKVVHDVDDTIVRVFGEAFDDVAREYEGVIARLFPGGSGGIKLTDPSDLLGSGIEIEARPPGKNVRKLTLLSGGERSLVALAFLFSIFRSRPSPFYLLDEVEAALDDVNLHRFLGLVDELEERAQILIVTHQKRTMEAADVLYGVSMAKDGVSRVVAKRMQGITV